MVCELVTVSKVFAVCPLTNIVMDPSEEQLEEDDE